MKTCRTCNQTKPADAYRGTRSTCRECESARRREWYAAQAVKPYHRGLDALMGCGVDHRKMTTEEIRNGELPERQQAAH